VDPLDPGRIALGDLLNGIGERSRPFWEQQIHDLFLLHDAGHFAGAPQVAALISAQSDWYEAHRSKIERQLADAHPDGLAPEDFRWTLDPQGGEKADKSKHNVSEETSG